MIKLTFEEWIKIMFPDCCKRIKGDD